MTLTHGELFAGISGFGLGFGRAGIAPRWHVEIDRDARRVLAHHYHDTDHRADVRHCGARNLAPVDVITFGSPCQDLSVAGRRAGIGGARSGLFFEAVRIIGELRPALAIWENVPGALSSNGGRDFGTALDALADVGALAIGWAVLDAQWFGVAQRRRRVFVVASFADWADPAEILSLGDGLSGDTPPRRETGQGIAATLTRGSASGRGVNQPRRHQEDDVNIIAHALTTRSGQRMEPTSDTLITHTLTGEGHDASEDGTGRSTPIIPLLEVGARTNGDGYRDGDGIGADGDPMYTLQASKQHGVLAPTAFSNRGISGDAHETLRAGSHGALPMIAYSVAVRGREDGQEWELGEPEIGNALRAGDGGSSRGNWALTPQMAVRRLTPTECLRLQGFPDDWLDLDPPLSDSAKYRLCGNAVCVPVAEWLGRRIVEAGADGR